MSKENGAQQQKDVMATLKNRKKGKKRIILIVVIAVIVLLFVWVKQSMEKAMATVQETLTQMQTDEVSKRSLVKSVGATGTIVSVQSKDLKSDLTGVEISEVLVEIGDVVTEGQALVVFDTSDIEENLESAEKQLSIAEQRNALSAQDAKRNVENAQRTESYQVDAAKTSMDNAYDKYEIAMVDYNNASKTLDNLKKDEGKIYDEYIKAKKAVETLPVSIQNKEVLIAEIAAKLKELESVSDSDAVGYENVLEEYNRYIRDKTKISSFSTMTSLRLIYVIICRHLKILQYPRI